MIAKLIAITRPVIEGCKSPEDLIVYCGRVSNPHNQSNYSTSQKLLNYLIRNKHWSPFEMVHLVIEVETTRDIGRQILRHRSFSFQEFSQRYSEVLSKPILREARTQDTKNRQHSFEIKDNQLHGLWDQLQNEVLAISEQNYHKALNLGIAKEQARALLPEGLTSTKIYISGSLRSWIHYCWLRSGNGTQKEHQKIALECLEIIKKEFPSLGLNE